LIPFLLLVFLTITAFAMIQIRYLFAAVMLSGIFSLLSAGIYTVMDAVDVAFTEAAVGAGISSVLMVATLAFTSRREKPTPKGMKIGPLAVALATGGLLLYGTLDLPGYGDPDAPIHHHVAPRYLEKSVEEVGPPNVVTSVLASYRGYDTFGETTVIFTAAIGVLLLIGELRELRPRRKDEDEDQDEDEDRDDDRDDGGEDGG
jgi:multicomponent Na+:H+ antiporter subunit B